MLKKIVVAKAPSVYKPRSEVLPFFTDRTKALEAQVNELLKLAGWTDKHYGCAAKGNYYIAKTGDLTGEYIGLWSKDKLDDAVKVWSVNLHAGIIAESVVALVEGAPAPTSRKLLMANPAFQYMQ